MCVQDDMGWCKGEEIGKKLKMKMADTGIKSVGSTEINRTREES